MPRYNTTFLKNDIGLQAYLRDVYAYPRALYKGMAAGLKGLKEDLSDPINKMILPNVAFAYDLAIVGSAMMGDAVMSDPQFEPYQSEIAEIRRTARKDPQIVEDAKARLYARYEILKAAGKNFLASDGPGRVETATQVITDLVTARHFSKALGVISGAKKFATPSLLREIGDTTIAVTHDEKFSFNFSFLFHETRLEDLYGPRRSTPAPFPTFPVNPSPKQESKQDRHLDEAVKKVVFDHFRQDAHVLRLYKDYQNSSNRKRAFSTFHRQLNQHLVAEHRRGEYFEAAASISHLLSVIPNRDIQKIGTVLGAGVAAYKGMLDLKNAIDVIKLGTSGMSAAATITSLANPVTAIVGVFGTLMSVFAGPQEDGTGEAIAAMHADLMNFWSDTRQNFREVFRGLDAVLKNQDEMERNNWERFKAQMGALEYLSTQIAHSTDVLRNAQQVDQAKTDSSFALLHDQDMHAVIATIEKREEADRSRPEVVRDHSVKLFAWLLRVATTPARTIPLERDASGRFVMGPEKLAEELEKTLRPTRDPLDLPLGLYAGLAERYLPGLFDPKATLVNPRGWFTVLDVYLEVLKKGKEGIRAASPQVRAVYYKELNTLAEMVDDMDDIFKKIVHSNLLLQLIKQFKENIDELRYKLESDSKYNRADLPATLNFSLFQNATENFGRMKAALPNHEDIASQLLENVTWVGLKGTRDTSCPPSLCFGSHEYITSGDFGVELSQAQYDVLKAKSKVALRTNDSFTLIRRHLEFALGYAHNKLAQPSLAYDGRFIYNFLKNFFKKSSCAYTLFLYPSILIAERNYPFAHINLFYSSCQRTHGFGITSQYVNVNHPNPTRHSNFYVRNEFTEQGPSLIYQAFDEQVLIPARKKVLEHLSKPREIEAFTLQFTLAYLELISFLKLVDPRFKPVIPSTILPGMTDKIARLIQEGTHTALKELYDDAVHANAWCTDLKDYLGNSTSCSPEALIARVRQNSSSHPLLTGIAVARRKIQQVQYEIDPLFHSDQVQAQEKVLQKPQ